MSIHNIAFSSISYANSDNIRYQATNMEAAKGMGISVEELKNLSLNPENRGSIAFTRLNAENSSLYFGGGEDLGQAVQTTSKVNQYTRMDLPESVFHDTTGAKINIDGKKYSLNREILKQDIQFHDWMKEYAQNIKDTLPEGAVLPKGTQELLDAPSTDQMAAAARARLLEAGRDGPYEGLRIASMNLSEGQQGDKVYDFLYLEDGVEKRIGIRPEGLAPHIEQAKKDIPFSGNSFSKKIGFQDSIIPQTLSSMDDSARPSISVTRPVSQHGISRDGFFKLGDSAKDLVDADMVDATNKSIAELDFSGASYMKKEAGSSTLKNIGSVRGFQDNLTGFITTHDVANATLHPGALSGRPGQMAASSFSLATHNIDLNDFARYINAENFDIPNMTAQQLGRFEGLNFSANWFNRSALEAHGHTNDVLQKMRPLQTALHEMGHTGSRVSGADASDNAINRLTASLNAPQRNLTTIKSDYFNLVRERAFEEARAETFSYSALGKTSVGQEYLQHLRTADLTKDVTDKAIRANTFTGTAYYNFNQLSTQGFDTYSDMGSGIRNMLTSLGENVDDLTLRANILGTGSILGATGFGEYSEFFEPIRDKLIEKNRQFILDNHGQEYVDIFDDALKVGQENRFSLSGIETTVPPTTATGTIAAPTVDDADVSAKVADNQTLKETPPKKKGPSNIGKPSGDIRTSPTNIGADPASGGKATSPTVTPSGTPHNAATTQNLTTKNTNPTTTGPKTQAKINSQTTASGASTATNRPAGPGSTKKARDLIDNGLRTAQDLAGGNARLMGIAGVAGLLGVGVMASRNRTKQNPGTERGTYMDESRRKMQY